MEALFIAWLKAYGYIILFFWSIVEGEMGLVMAGIMTHTGNMNYVIAIFVAGLGGFTGDQGFFYLGRFNKRFMQSKLHSQRHKLAIAYLLLRKYGWPIILIQRYLYGLRSIIPIAIGISNYSAKKVCLDQPYQRLVMGYADHYPGLLLWPGNINAIKLCQTALVLCTASSRQFYFSNPRLFQNCRTEFFIQAQTALNAEMQGAALNA